MSWGSCFVFLTGGILVSEDCDLVPGRVLEVVVPREKHHEGQEERARGQEVPDVVVVVEVEQPGQKRRTVKGLERDPHLSQYLISTKSCDFFFSQNPSSRDLKSTKSCYGTLIVFPFSQLSNLKIT